VAEQRPNGAYSTLWRPPVRGLGLSQSDKTLSDRHKGTGASAASDLRLRPLASIENLITFPSKKWHGAFVPTLLIMPESSQSVNENFISTFSVTLGRTPKVGPAAF
jgi:hypothetical protein